MTYNKVEDSKDDPGKPQDTGSNSANDGPSRDVCTRPGDIPARTRGGGLGRERSELGLSERGR